MLTFILTVVASGGVIIVAFGALFWLLVLQHVVVTAIGSRYFSYAVDLIQNSWEQLWVMSLDGV